MIQNIKLVLKDIMYTDGKNEIVVVTPQQWAGRMRRRGYKKSILVKKDMATISINIKTK